jgi:PAS domain S-box-containing protein
MTLHGIVSDVTERKQSKEALMDERHLLHTLMDNLPDTVYFKDRESRFTQINLSLANAFGLNHPSQAVGKTDFDFYSAEHAELAYRDEQEIVRTGQPIVGKEEKETWPDGSVTWVSTTKMALRDSSGKIIGTFGVSRDITLRKRAEDAIREGELRYRSLLSNIPDIAWTVDDKLRFAFIGDNIEMVSGYSRAEIYERGAQIYLESLHPEDVQKVKEGFRALLATGQPFEVECRLKRKDGAWIWVHDRAIATYEKDGIRYADGLISDITERKRAEAEMAERHRLSILVAEVGGVLTRAESLRQGLQECAEILTRSIGAAFARIWTVNEEENVLELQASAGIYTHINGGHARVPVGKSKIGRIAESGVPHLTNSVQEDSWVGDAEWAGREGMVAFAGYPLKVEERVLGVVAAFARQPLTETTLQAVASVADATAQFIKRKRAEEALRLTQFSVEHAADGVFWMDSQGRIVYVNEAACRSLGRSREEVLSLSIPDIDPLVPKENWGTVWAQIKARGSMTFESQHQTKLGRIFPVEVTANYLDFDGKEYSFAFAHDITERREVERTKSELVSVVSHELRTPLTSIRGALGLLAGGLLRSQPEKGERMLEIAVSNTDRLVRLINDILDLERMESGKMNMEKQTCNAAQLMTQAVDSVRDLAEKAGVALSVTTQSVRLWGDPDRIIQAFINLLSNAIKFSPQGRTIWFSAAPQVDVILFEVKDNGRGIPHEKQASIFERFQQVDASDRREKGGTGLGLPITRSIAQQHGGRVWVRSTEGQGSTFFLTLPLMPAETTSVSDGRGGKSVLGKVNDGPRVLVVEDDPDLARVLTTVFERHGAVVVNARTGQEAVQVCPQFIPDLLVLDVMLPELDGFGVVEQLRKHERLRHLPVAVYSVKELDDSERARLRLGESIFMTKSRLTPQEFEERAIGLLNWARSGCKERRLQ